MTSTSLMLKLGIPGSPGKEIDIINGKEIDIMQISCKYLIAAIADAIKINQKCTRT